MTLSVDYTPGSQFETVAGKQMKYWISKGEIGNAFMLYVMQHEGWESISYLVGRFIPTQTSDFQRCMIEMYTEHRRKQRKA